MAEMVVRCDRGGLVGGERDDVCSLGSIVVYRRDGGLFRRWWAVAEMVGCVDMFVRD